MTQVVSTTTQIRRAMADALRVIPGLHVAAYQMASQHTPAAQIIRGPVEWDEAFEGGVHRPNYLVRVFVATATDRGATELLDKFLDPEGDWSVKAALESDTSLGGVVQDLHVVSADGERIFVGGQGEPYLGSEWTVEVWL